MCDPHFTTPPPDSSATWPTRESLFHHTSHPLPQAAGKGVTGHFALPFHLQT